MPDRTFLQSFLDRYLERGGPPFNSIRADVQPNPGRHSYDIRLYSEVAYHVSIDRRDLLGSREQAARLIAVEVDGFRRRLAELLDHNSGVPPRVMSFRDEHGDLMHASSSDGTAPPFDPSAFSRQVDASLRAFGGRVGESLFSSSPSALSAAHVPPGIDPKPAPKSLWDRLDEVA